jgi:DNA-directed RNA polymerase subunit RPC12/RpoP
MAVGGIKVKCKACGKMADSTEFVLDPGYKMMVCRNCVHDRRVREEIHSKVKQQKEEQKKPKGWDAEDEVLERSCKMKAEKTVKVEHLDDNRIKYCCPKCKYEFVIKLDKMIPNHCPYCGANILSFR